MTQLFFDNELYYRFRDAAQAAGITVPIVVGVMPFTSQQQVVRMTFTCGATPPSPVVKGLARYADDPESLRKAGVEIRMRAAVRPGAQRRVGPARVRDEQARGGARACAQALRAVGYLTA